MTIKAIMLRAGTQIQAENTSLQNDPSCVEELYKHMCHFKKQATKPAEQPASDSPKPSILKPQGEHSPNEKKIKFEDETIDKEDEDLFISAMEFIEQLEEFFQIKQSVVLLDLQMLSELTKPAESSEQESVADDPVERVEPNEQAEEIQQIENIEVKQPR